MITGGCGGALKTLSQYQTPRGLGPSLLGTDCFCVPNGTTFFSSQTHTLRYSIGSCALTLGGVILQCFGDRWRTEATAREYTPKNTPNREVSYVTEFRFCDATMRIDGKIYFVQRTPHTVRRESSFKTCETCTRAQSYCQIVVSILLANWKRFPDVHDMDGEQP